MDSTIQEGSEVPKANDRQRDYGNAELGAVHRTSQEFSGLDGAPHLITKLLIDFLLGEDCWMVQNGHGTPPGASIRSVHAH
ncbi:MAG: hypothetical protein Kow0074_18600 [Candidatus Zixiibacteriota bacterium]